MPIALTPTVMFKGMLGFLLMNVSFKTVVSRTNTISAREVSTASDHEQKKDGFHIASEFQTNYNHHDHGEKRVVRNQ